MVELLKVLLKARAEDAGVASKLIATVADLDYSGSIIFNQAQGIVAIVWRGDAALGLRR